MSRRPRGPHRVPLRRLLLMALASVTTWLIVSSVAGSERHPRYLEMLEAARSVQRAMQVVRAAKQELSAMPPPGDDPNATGLIGPELTEIVTTLGSLGSKRTATNPDLAALFVRWFDAAGLRAGDGVVFVLSGSFPGANVAALAAAESLRLRPVIVNSAGASMYGATDPELTWLDIHSKLVDAGVLLTRPALAVVGGIDGNGQGLAPDGVEAVRAAATRTATRLVEAETLTELVDRVQANIEALAGSGVDFVVVVGGPAVGTGSCLELTGIIDGVAQGPVTCVGGTPGLLSTLTAKGAGGVHLLNLRFLALTWGLPFDPVPLPTPGDNRAVYGGR